MTGSTITILIIVGVIVLATIFVIASYNRLVGLRNAYRNAFSQIDVQLKRRHDLIPNLVETVKGYAKHEAGTLQAVTDARAKAETARQLASNSSASAQDVGALSIAEGALDSAMGRFRATFEAYPDLKANQNFLSLQEELSSTENRVAYSRQAYNDSVMSFNTKAQSFPTNVVAGLFGFDNAAQLEFADREAIQQSPTVSF